MTNLWPIPPRHTAALLALAIAFVLAALAIAAQDGIRCYFLRESSSGSLTTCTYDCPSGEASITVRPPHRCPRYILQPER